MAARYTVSAVAGPTEAYFDAPATEGDPTVAIPKWLMVLAARGDVTLSVAVSLEDDPIDGFDDASERD